MTFKLTIGDRLVRDDRSPASKTASDLVRDFRKRLRDDARRTEAAKREPGQIAIFSRGRGPNMARSED
jgi:hypothetical protein